MDARLEADYLNSWKIDFIAFQALKLPRNKLNQCQKICQKLISHLASGKQYPAFPSGAIFVLKFIGNRYK